MDSTVLVAIVSALLGGGISQAGAAVLEAQKRKTRRMELELESQRQRQVQEREEGRAEAAAARERAARQDRESQSAAALFAYELSGDIERQARPTLETMEALRAFQQYATPDQARAALAAEQATRGAARTPWPDPYSSQLDPGEEEQAEAATQAAREALSEFLAVVAATAGSPGAQERHQEPSPDTERR